MPRALAAVLITLSATAACADSVREMVTPGNTSADAPTEWIGGLEHFMLAASVEGHHFDVQYPNMRDASGIAEFSASRSYETGPDGLKFDQFEITLKTVIEGVEKTIEMSFETEDFASLSLPAVFVVTPEASAGQTEVAFEMEFEWTQGDSSVDVDADDWSGVFTFVRNEGLADASQPSDDGTVAGFLTAKRGLDRLAASFTVPVTSADIPD